MRAIALLGGRAIFWCPGCDEPHMTEAGYKFNGSQARPTITPSLLNIGRNALGVPRVCHCEVTAGHIKFFMDSTHAERGKTMELPDWPPTKDR